MRKSRYKKLVGVLLDEATYKEIVRITDNKEIAISKYIRGIVEEKLLHVDKEDEDNV